MSENSSSLNFLTMETLGLSPAYVYPAFVFGTFTYLTIVFCNLLVLLTIAVSKRLHKPMFLLLFNLPIIDLLGATAFFPQLVISIVTENRLISSPACITQAVLIHLYGTGNLLILNAMAYDRYIAICLPLKYNTFMTPYNMIIVIVLIWIINFSIITVLFALTLQFKFCRTDVVDLFCNNPSLVKLICDNTSASNYYGIVTTFMLMGGSLLTLLYTYSQILYTCVMTNHTDARRKAIQTCGTHLFVFLFFQVNTAFTLFSHRFQSASPYLRRAIGVSILIFPPVLDPIVYGLKTKELKEGIMVFLKRNMGTTK